MSQPFVHIPLTIGERSWNEVKEAKCVLTLQNGMVIFSPSSVMAKCSPIFNTGLTNTKPISTHSIVW